MEENCIAVGGGGEMGKAAEGESRHMLSSRTEGEMIYVLSSPSVSRIFVSIKFVSIKSLFISLLPISLLFIIVSATSCYLFRCTNIKYSSCVYSLHGWLHSFKSIRHSPGSLSAALSATFREHGSDSPTLVTLPDSTSNNISTRPFIFYFRRLFLLFRAVMARPSKFAKDVLTVWFECKENRAESNAQHCTVAFLYTVVGQLEVCSGDKERACENGGEQQMRVCKRAR